MLSDLKKFLIKNKRSSKVLSFNEGILIITGILRVNVSSNTELGFSVVAEIINTSECLNWESPNLLKVPVSKKINNASCPSGGSLWISSRKRIPPSACSISPVLSDSAPV